MKRISKLLVLVLSLALIVGAIFAVSASAAEDEVWTSVDLSSSVTGATRLHRDFTGESFEIYKIMDGVNAPDKVLNNAPANLYTFLASKTGHLRSASDVNGNTYAEYAVRVDRNDGFKGNDDVIVGLHPSSSTVVTNLSYVTYEFDMATLTDFPANIKIFAETRIFGKGSTGGDVKVNDVQYRLRPVFATYNKGEGTWSIGNQTLSTEVGEWAHITLVLQINKITADDGSVNYKDSVVNVYVNGKYAQTVGGIFGDVYVPSNLEYRIYYCGIGYNYGQSMAGTKANDGVAIDNLVYTTYTDAYAQDADNAYLADLFGEDPVTDIADLGPEIVWGESYKLPENSGDVSVIDSDETEYGPENGVTSLKSAIAFIHENEMEDATLKLYGNQYNSFTFDFPLTVDLNGYSFNCGYEVPDSLAVDYDAEAGTFTISSDPSKLTTINYYTSPKGQSTAPALVQSIALGRTINNKTGDIIARAIAEGNKVHSPLTTYKVYDSEGNEFTLPETVTNEMLGQTYSVYFDYEVKEFESDVYFSVKLDGKVTYYCGNNDIAASLASNIVVKGEVTEADGTKTWSEVTYPMAVSAGATITLLSDCTLSSPLRTVAGTAVYVDLNGYTLSASCAFVDTTAKATTVNYSQVGDAEPTKTGETKALYVQNNKAYFYSSGKGGAMVTTSDMVDAWSNADPKNGASYYFGYKPNGSVSDYRITITFGTRIANVYKGGVASVSVANADLYNITASEGLFRVIWSRDPQMNLTNVNVFTKSPLTASTAGDGTKTLYLTDTNVYAEGGVPVHYTIANTSGVDKVYLTNSKIYGMSFGITSGDASIGGASATKHEIYIKDSTSMVSATHPSQLKLSGVEGVMVAKPETVVINGVSYSTVYRVGTGKEKTATFNIYDVTFDKYTEGMTPVATLEVVAGYWFGYGAKPSGDDIYDITVDKYNILTPDTYLVYDENGNVLTTGSAIAGASYNAFVTYRKTPVSFAVVNADGTATPYFTTCINDAVVTDGCTIVLLSADAYSITSTLIWKNVSLDMNGKTVYVSGKKFNSFQPAADSNIFIYSSAEGAKFHQVYQNNSNGYVVQLNNTNSKFYFGYQNATTLSEYRISVYTGAFTENKNADCDVYLGNLDMYKIAGDNYGYLNFRDRSTATRDFIVEGCNIFVYSGNVVHIRATGAVGEVIFKNTNFYIKSSGGFVNYDQNPTTSELKITFENVGIYGGGSMGAVPAATTLTVNVKGNFTTAFLSDAFVLEDGKTMLPYGTTQTFAGHTAPASGVYGAQETVYFKGDYASNYTVGTPEEFKASALQNMTLDTNVVVNLYLPKSNGIVSAKIGEKEILDPTKTETIGGVTYYVLSYGAAPKQGDQAATVVVTLADGSTYEFEMSVARYAKALQSVQAEEGSYVADAQNLMKYILTYIKEVAVKYGGADEETIFAELLDFSVDTDVTMTETVYDLSAINTYVTHAALDLDAYAGFAFKVAQGFVGTVKLELAGVPAAEYVYTEEAPAGATEIIVLENVPVHIFRGDVVITVTTAEGETVQASFNLATYAATYDEAYVKALYAYSIAAKEYNAKYPTVGKAN